MLKIRAAIRTVSDWISERPYLSLCIGLAMLFAFAGGCSKSDYYVRTSEERAYLKLLRERYGGEGRKVDAAAAAASIGQACAFIAAAEGAKSGWDTPDVRDLLLATAAAESDLRARFQDSGGDAIGLFQIEYGTFRDLWRRAIKYKYPRLYRAMRKHYGDAESGEIKFEDLQKNDVVGAIFARVKYFESGQKTPSRSDVDAQARYYKNIYNTDSGAGDAEIFKRKKRALFSEK